MAIPHCRLCGRRYRGRGPWNVVLKSGVATGLLCPDCQTPEENAEAEINAATTVYSRDSFGRVIGRAVQR